MVKNIVFWAGLAYCSFLVAFHGANIFAAVVSFLFGYWLFSWFYEEFSRSIAVFASFAWLAASAVLSWIKRVVRK